MKTDSHNSICKVKGLLHPISVMHVDIYIQNPGVILEQFQNSDDDVVDIAKTGRFEFLCVMQTSGPVNSNITVVVVEFHGAFQRRTRVHRTEVKQTVEYWTVVADVVVAEMLREILYVLRRYSL